MVGSSKPPTRDSVRSLAIGKIALWTVALVPTVFACLSALYWLNDRVPESWYWKAGLILLIVLEVAYWHVVVLTGLGVIVLGFVLLRGRRQRYRPMIARGFLLSVSLSFGLIAAETASAIVQNRAHRRTAVPVGGLRKGGSAAPSSIAFKPPDIELPTKFSVAKQDGEINLVIVGESSAEGVPYQSWVSIGEMIHWQLNLAFPGRAVRVETVATSGDTLERQHEKLVGLKRRPDALLIYCGHNEFSTRFQPSRDIDYYSDERLPNLWMRLAKRIGEVSPLTELIRETAEKFRIAIPPPENGNRALVDTPVYTLEEHAALLNDFERRLDAMVSYAEQIGALPVLIVPPANDTGFEPNRSFLPASTRHDEREAFRRDFLAARALESADPRRSLEKYRALLARQTRFAETHYRMAQLLERQAAWDEAYDHYVLARDLDGYPIRTPSDFQHIYHEVASRHDSILIDAQSYFHAIGRHGLLDENLFHDGIHPSLRGQIALAQALLQEFHARGIFGLPNSTPAPVIDPADCVKKFGLVPAVWRRICLWGILFYDLTAYVRYDPSHRLQMKVAFATAANRIEAGEAPESVGLPNIGVPAPVPVPRSVPSR